MPTDTCYPTTLLLGGLICLAQQAHAQTTCITETDETDPFTKVRVLSVSAPTIVGGPACRWRSVDRMLSLEFTWTTSTTERVAVLERDPLLLMLENDSVIELISLRTEVANRQVDAQGNIRDTGAYEYQVTPTQAKLLSKYWVNRLRLYHTNGYQEFVADKDPIWQQGLERLTTCFLQACTTEQLPTNTVVSQKAAVPQPAP